MTKFFKIIPAIALLVGCASVSPVASRADVALNAAAAPSVPSSEKPFAAPSWSIKAGDWSLLEENVYTVSRKPQVVALYGKQFGSEAGVAFVVLMKVSEAQAKTFYTDVREEANNRATATVMSEQYIKLGDAKGYEVIEARATKDGSVLAVLSVAATDGSYAYLVTCGADVGSAEAVIPACKEFAESLRLGPAKK